MMVAKLRENKDVHVEYSHARPHSADTTVYMCNNFWRKTTHTVNAFFLHLSVRSFTSKFYIQHTFGKRRLMVVLGHEIQGCSYHVVNPIQHGRKEGPHNPSGQRSKLESRSHNSQNHAKSYRNKYIKETKTIAFQIIVNK